MDDVASLVRARYLLAATLDDHRAIVGRVSRAWILSETERQVARSQLPEAVLRHPSLAGLGAGAPDERLNTNRLPKLEPLINAYVLAGAILYGTRLYGAGTADEGLGVRCREMENELIIAAMVHATLGQPDRFSALLPAERRTVDEDRIAELFGADVLRHLVELRRHLAAFDDAQAVAPGTDLAIPPPYANAIAALKASLLRLTARAAGDGIFRLLDEAKRAELEERGVAVGAPGDAFPEWPYLASDYATACAAVALPGVDAATIRTPVEGQLLRNVGYVLDRAVPPGHLVGRYGAALHQFHTVLPILYRYSPVNRRLASGEGEGEASREVEGPYALGTLHLTGLEVTRYLNNVRRKGYGTGAGHSFVVSSRAEFVLRGHRSVPILAGCDCHDVIEDGGLSVTGYDHSLELFAARFGAPLAALVAEVTDSITKADGPAKAATFLDQPTLVLPDELYNVGQFEELRAVATDPAVPFTLAGAVMKLADTGTTQAEGLRDPDLMVGVWRHSGARVFWDQTVRGSIVRPLWERLAAELRLSQADPFYHRRSGTLPAFTLQRLRELLTWSFEHADLYAVQNLALLAREYGLDPDGRQALIAGFLAPDVDQADFAATLDARLDDACLPAEVRQRGLAATYRLQPDGAAVRDPARLLDYRRSAARRSALRDELGIEPPPAGHRDDVVRALDLWLGTPLPGSRGEASAQTPVGMRKGLGRMLRPHTGG